MTEEQTQDQYKRWKEVSVEKAEYVIVLRAASSDTSVTFYMNKEDMLWAMKNSWFDPKDAIIAKVLPWEITI